ncbi:MAG TPA: response regulator, partial [Desulfurivibrionaceae bacterium]|nr:response regulator [Desulfurivibrionaceae bacterium]
GLGLTICYSIITKHHGLLKTESTLGVGTTFTIYLPAFHAAAPEEAPETQWNAPSLSGTGRVLIMDDDKPIRDIAAEMLKQLGYESDQAGDGKATLASYRQAMETDKPYVAVLMDLTIPGGMGGKETIVELIALDPKVKAIVSSGYSYDPIMAEPGRYGFRGVVTKPYDLVQLGKILHQVIHS